MAALTAASPQGRTARRWADVYEYAAPRLSDDPGANLVYLEQAAWHLAPELVQSIGRLDVERSFRTLWASPRSVTPHRILAGRDPWTGITVRREHVRRQLEHELMGKLVHLRQAYVAGWNHPKRLAEVVRGTRAGFLTMLRAVLRLAGRTAPADSAALVRDAAALIGFAPDGLTEPAAYLQAVTRTAEYLNRMERNPS